jgi:hypothetical protein
MMACSDAQYSPDPKAAAAVAAGWICEILASLHGGGTA